MDSHSTPAGAGPLDGPVRPSAEARKLCTCDGAGRGPGRACVVKAGGRLGDLWRCAQGVEPDEWLHLKCYGYAPGGYMSKCHRCKQVVIMDKRAVTCRPCAEAMAAEQDPDPHEDPQAIFGDPRA